jgi:DNA-binding PadR family transcriptional regulator
MAAAGLVRADVGPDEVAIYELTPGGQELLDRT